MPASTGPTTVPRPPTTPATHPATTAVTVPPSTAATVPATSPSTSPPRTIGACQAVGLDVANGWRAELGRDPLAWSNSLYSGACAWATHLAELGGTGSHQAGPYAEVIYWSTGCGGMWNSWRNSSGHYNAITGEPLTTGAFVTVTDSNGRCWAVGRMAL
ncbi:MAG: CAP domain-containing protein [Ilumatobacteraceae bacterium]